VRGDPSSWPRRHSQIGKEEKRCLVATRLEFRLEVFNLFDRKIWGAPESSLTSQNFGRVTTLANSPRQVQLGLRFEF